MGVISTPPRVHVCAPGWTYTDLPPEGLPMPFGGGHIPMAPGTRSAHPPNPHDFPRGTVWECDTCQQRWISRGARDASIYDTVQVLDWKREGAFARWRRLRREAS